MILLDASHNLFRNIWMNVEDIKENPDYLAHLILRGYLKAARDFGASIHNRVLVACDSKPSWRHAYYLEEGVAKIKDYEGKKYKDRPKDDSLPWDELWEVFGVVHAALHNHSDFDVVKEDDAEADDIIAIATKVARERGETVWIVSNDKDFKQLQEEPYVNIYDPVRKMFVPTLDPEVFKKLHIIQGDKSDSILAIKSRVGPKTAEKMLPDIDMILKTDPVMRQKYEFNQNMVDFDFIPEELVSRIRKKIETTHGKYSMLSLSKVFEKYRLRQLIGNIQNFRLKDVILETEMTKQFKRERELEDYASHTLENFFDED